MADIKWFFYAFEALTAAVFITTSIYNAGKGPYREDMINKFTDLSEISKNYYNDSVKFQGVVAFSVICALITIVYAYFVQYTLISDMKDLWNKVWITVRYCVFGLTSCCAAVFMTQRIVGKMSPRFVGKCFGDNTKLGVFYDYNDVNSRQACVGMAQIDLSHEYKSFPDGHSAIAFVGASLLAFYMYKMNKNKEHNPWKVLWSSIPLMGAFFISASRLHDNASHLSDVIIGIVMGILFAFGSSKIYLHRTQEEKREAGLQLRQTEIEEFIPSERKLKF